MAASAVALVAVQAAESTVVQEGSIAVVRSIAPEKRVGFPIAVVLVLVAVPDSARVQAVGIVTVDSEPEPEPEPELAVAVVPADSAAADSNSERVDSELAAVPAVRPELPLPELALPSNHLNS